MATAPSPTPEPAAVVAPAPAPSGRRAVRFPQCVRWAYPRPSAAELARAEGRVPAAPDDGLPLWDLARLVTAKGGTR